jgi:hypothetical protein
MNDYNNNKWKDTDSRFVAFFDILGFKELVFNNTHNEMLLKIDTLLQLVNEVSSGMNSRKVKPTNFNHSWTNGNIKEFIFSDSIVLFSESDDVNSAAKILVASSAIIIGSMIAELPIKGAIAHGEITVNIDKSIFYGKPLINSYTLHDELKMYGTIIHNSAERIFDKYDLLNTPMIFRHETCPLKLGNVNHHLTNWVWLYDVLKMSKYKGTEDMLDLNIFLDNATKEMYFGVSGSTRKYVENTIDSINIMKKLTKLETTKIFNKALIDNMNSD